MLGVRVKYDFFLNNSDDTLDLIVWLLIIHFGDEMNLKIISLHNQILDLTGPGESQFGPVRVPTQQGLWCLSGLWSDH